MADSINGAVKDALGVAAPETSVVAPEISVAAPETSSEMQAHRLRDDVGGLVVVGVIVSTLGLIIGLFLFTLGIIISPFCWPIGVPLIVAGIMVIVMGISGFLRAWRIYSGQIRFGDNGCEMQNEN